MEREALAHDAAPRARAGRKTDRTEQPVGDASLRAAVIGGRSPIRPATALGLQRTAGNAAVTTLVQRRMGKGDEEQVDTSPVLDVIGKGGGTPLKPALQKEMEARLGTDFSDVRVHQDSKAARSAEAVSARAYTVRNEIVLGEKAPDLESPDGKKTLAHELTHVIQQRQGAVSGTASGNGVAISDPADRFEQAAEANAARAMADTSPGASVVQRQDEEEIPEEETEETP